MKPYQAYRLYMNDFLTIGGFADYYCLSDHVAKALVLKGRLLDRDHHNYPIEY